MSGKVSAVVTGLFIGKTEAIWAKKPPSAIRKKPHNGPLTLDVLGFIEDEQADCKVHGGLEKAVHHYAAEHLEYWKKQFPEKEHEFIPGCFGENISTTGLNEKNLCIGDILSLGTAIVQVCQGRQPCWKLNLHLNLKDLALQFQNSGRTGWYYRVLESGTVSVGDSIELIRRTETSWPLSRVISARFDRKLDPFVASELSNLQTLSENWRTAFGKKSTPSFVENVAKRLLGPG